MVEKKLAHCCHFDERGAAFFALGYNKAQLDQGQQKNLACVITTSGSAIANTYPAVTEAYESETPLLVLTADRPKKLHGVRANQTTKQNHFFANHCLHSLTLNFENPQFSNGALLKAVQKIFINPFVNFNGPCHINISLSEPFIFDRSLNDLSNSKKNSLIKKYISVPKPNQKNPSAFQSALTAIKKIFDDVHKKNEDCLVVVGECFSSESKLILQALQHCPYPVFVDITVPNALLVGKKKSSQLPFIFHHQTFADAIEFPIHTIIHFGGAFVSKSLATYLEKNPPKNYIHIEAPRRTKKYDPNKVVTKHFSCDYSVLMPHVQMIFQEGKKQRKKIPNATKMPAAKTSVAKNLSITQKIKIAAKENDMPPLAQSNKALSLTERIFVFGLLAKSQQRTKTNVFLGNSMPIRMGDIYPNANGFCSVFSNRGVSGIDGLIATICGIAQQNKSEKLIGVVGDLCALHDLNSLFFLTNLKSGASVSLVIINNAEGSIFRHLKWFENFQKASYAKTILHPHKLEFLSIAKMASLPYRCLKNITKLDDCLNWIFQSGNKILEVKVDAKKSMADYKKYCEESKNIFLKKLNEDSQLDGDKH